MLTVDEGDESRRVGGGGAGGGAWISDFSGPAVLTATANYPRSPVPGSNQPTRTAKIPELSPRHHTTSSRHNIT